jgi:hypothetical protein
MVWSTLRCMSCSSAGSSTRHKVPWESFLGESYCCDWALWLWIAVLILRSGSCRSQRWRATLSVSVFTAVTARSNPGIRYPNSEPVSCVTCLVSAYTWQMVQCRELLLPNPDDWPAVQKVSLKLWMNSSVWKFLFELSDIKRLLMNHRASGSPADLLLGLMTMSKLLPTLISWRWFSFWLLYPRDGITS